MTVRILVGDVRAVIGTLPDASVQCCVTSPPYFGLRDYGHAGQIGLEPTPDEYVAQMVAVFREVRRVLREDGTLWLNLGDSYARGFGGGTPGEKSASNAGSYERRSPGKVPDGLKAKDLIGIPWRVAFALQADGWVLRSDVIWQKPNPMPESVTDRPTKAHEYVFMFSKAKWVGEPRGRFAHISDADARWLALLLDTEGNIQVKRVERDGRKWYGAQIAIAGTSRDLMETAHRMIGAGTVAERDGKNAPMFYVQLGNRQAAALLHRIYPFLIVKRRQARIVMHLQSLLRYRGGRGADRRRTDAEVDVLESLWMRNKQCNRFGTPDLSDVPEPKYGKWALNLYYYDAAAIAEPVKNDEKTQRVKNRARHELRGKGDQQGAYHGRGAVKPFSNWKPLRNARSVWPIATQPYKGAHFATMPPALAERCIKAGTKRGDTVLDPFGGAGTTGLVAARLDRDAVLCELNPAYARLAADRVVDECPLLGECDVVDAGMAP